ncbi:uncharacterized protein LOC141532172 [Cotesia typhae]|uniref:uncharacterized protein LOC141532172 n=1 Tax=Cotesia typhae TaxID=2053667 RepID=UPI003D69753D
MLNTVCFITAFKMHLQNSTRYLNWQMILRLLLMITKLEQAMGSLSKNFLKIIGLIHHSSKVSNGFAKNKDGYFQQKDREHVFFVSILTDIDENRYYCEDMCFKF